MIATPETDAFIESLHDDWDVEFANLTGHAKKLERERDRYRRGVELIAEDCEAWLNGENHEPSVDFIKLVAKYARGVLQ